ncbi:MAG: hypothetical protein AVDCRST_MAG41-1858 [uncultured Corynebacteriales bacterium]|uniref:Uncharacterized protein n=1 Tax=uncultured Mycobacteriales bacterium TaxID=581187 RepID=A0A6J4IFS1_9ACTN|nr:MAG: hypothetical protein AVDCRST_MAG41-1858 [uncultured Corynebacteriales bacterium]
MSLFQHPGPPPVRRVPALAQRELPQARAIAERVERLRRDTDAAELLALREGEPDLLRRHLERALVEAHAALDDVVDHVDRLRREGRGNALTPRELWDPDSREDAIRTAARALDRTDGARALRAALAGLDPDDDAVENGYDDLRAGLRRLQQALRGIRRHDRPPGAEQLRLLVRGTLRTVGTVALALDTAAGITRWDGASAADAAVAAAAARAGDPEPLVELVRVRVRDRPPAQRLRAAHEDLTLLVGDFAEDCERGRPSPETYAAALLAAQHAARWAQRLAWSAGYDYLRTARQVPEVLGPAMAAARAADRPALADATKHVREIHESLGRYRVPDGLTLARRA